MNNITICIGKSGSGKSYDMIHKINERKNEHDILLIPHLHHFNCELQDQELPSILTIYFEDCTSTKKLLTKIQDHLKVDGMLFVDHIEDYKDSEKLFKILSSVSQFLLNNDIGNLWINTLSICPTKNAFLTTSLIKKYNVEIICKAMELEEATILNHLGIINEKEVRLLCQPTDSYISIKGIRFSEVIEQCHHVHKLVAFDPSTTCTGYSIYDNISGELLYHNVIDKSFLKITNIRIPKMMDEIITILNRYNPEAVIIETPPYVCDPNATKKLSNVIGVILWWIYCKEIDSSSDNFDSDVSPSWWRKIVANGEKYPVHSKECKEWDLMKAKELFPMEEFIDDNDADACLLGYAFITARKNDPNFQIRHVKKKKKKSKKIVSKNDSIKEKG